MATTAGQHAQGDKRPLIFAAILGLVAAVLVAVVLSDRDDASAPAQPAVTNVSVVFAARDIAVGDRITAEMVEVRTIPQTAAADTAFGNVNDVIGTRARFPVSQGEQLTPLRLVETAPVAALSFQIPAGMRGFSIPVDTGSSPSAVLVPGDFIDVLLTIDVLLVPVLFPAVDPVTLQETGDTAVGLSEEGDRVVGTLFQNLQVISVGETFVSTGEEYQPETRGERPEGSSGGFVILAVTPEQAQVLTLAKDLGTLSMTLRPFADEEFVPLEPFIQPFRIPMTAPATQPVTE